MAPLSASLLLIAGMCVSSKLSLSKLSGVILFKMLQRERERDVCGDKSEKYHKV